MSEWLETLQFSPQDVVLLKLCPIVAAVGGFAHAWTLKGDFTKLPKNGRFSSKDEALGMLGWLGG